MLQSGAACGAAREEGVLGTGKEAWAGAPGAGAEAFVSHLPDPASAARRLAWLRRAAWLLDGAARVPGSRFRFGLNGLIGLVPGGGDAVLALLSLAIVWQARKLGAPPPLQRRMLANVAIEFAGGLLPIVGDVFDMAFKANLRNLDMLEQHLRRR